MSTIHDQQPRWLAVLSQRRQEAAYVLFALAGGLILFAGYLVFRHQSLYMPTVLGCIWAALTLFGVALWSVLEEQGARSDSDNTRLMVIIAGGLVGLDLFVVALYLVYRWWSSLVGGLEEWQGQNWWRIWVIALVGVGAMLLTFASLMLAKSQAENDPLMRRLFYGYNAVLGGMLVLVILVIVNILAYLFLPRESDWTKAKLYTLDTKSQNILKGLEKPVKVYMILDSREDPAYDDLTTLLNNCRTFTDKIQAELVLRGRQDARIRELMRRYLLVDPVGMLVVMGTDPHEDSQFVKRSDLYQYPPTDIMQQRRRRQEQPTFKGEDSLMTAISFLEEGKSRPTIYFLQGHGELDISTASDLRPNFKADELRSQLEKANYTVKALRFSFKGEAKGEDPNEVVAKQVPDDASVVVIAGPRGALEPETIQALRQYMNPKEKDKKKGKLMVLLGIETTPDKRMVSTGLEKFLQEFNVEVGNDRIMRVNPNNPDGVLVVPYPATNDRNSLATGLADMQPLPMFNVRTIRPRSSAAPRPDAGNYQVQILLATAVYRVWAESNLNDPVQVYDELVRSRKVVDVSPTLPVAVTVSEPSPSAMPADQFHARLSGGESTPRMVVVGNAAWASNVPLPGEQGVRASSLYYSLFASSLAWLREKPSNIGIESKKRDTYQMAENTNVDRLRFLPVGLMAVTILGLGLGVWVVRRR